MPGPVALFLSPHLDDVAFSCGGTVAALTRQGWRAVVATAFTASLPRPTGFALACQTDKGLGADVDYLAIRRDEDAGFGRAVGLGGDDLEWLGLAEAPHRGYDSAPALFAGVRPGDEAWREVAGALDRLDARHRPGLVFAPQGIGNHADHLQVIRAVLERPAIAARTAWYRDLPYAAKFPDARPDPRLPRGLVEAAPDLGPADLEAKLAGCACYATQLPFQFGGVAPMRRRLADFAAAEGSRLGRPGPVEAFLAPPGVMELFRPTGSTDSDILREGG